MTPRPQNPVVQTLIQRLRPRGVDAAALAAVLAEGRPCSLVSDEVLCAQDSQADGIYFLVSGTVRVLRRDAVGRDRELARIRAPAVLGHMAVIDRSPRSATVIAAGPVDLITVDRSTCERIINRPDAVGMALRRVMLTSLVRQLVEGNARIRRFIADAHPDAAPSGDDGGAAAASARTRRTRSPSDTAQEVDQLSALLDGWESLEDELDAVEVVYTEDQLRNWPAANPRR